LGGRNRFDLVQTKVGPSTRLDAGTAARVSGTGGAGGRWDGIWMHIYALGLSPRLTELLPKSGMSGRQRMWRSAARCCCVVPGGLGLAFQWGAVADSLRPLPAKNWRLGVGLLGVYGAAGELAENVWQLGALRCGGKSVSAVVRGAAGRRNYVAEAWPRRARWAGYLQPATYTGSLAAREFTARHSEGARCSVRTRTGDLSLTLSSRSRSRSFGQRQPTRLSRIIRCVRFLRRHQAQHDRHAGPSDPFRCGLWAGQSRQTDHIHPGESRVAWSSSMAARMAFDGHGARCGRLERYGLSRGACLCEARVGA